MPHRILYSPATSVTGQRIRDILGIPGSSRPVNGAQRPEILIRWGSAERVAHRPSRGVINNRGAVALASNKLISLQAMSQGHVRIPPLYLPDAVPRVATIFPLLGRRITHRQGADIILCMQRSDVVRNRGNVDFFTGYIPVAREFRVHAFRGEVLKLSEKVLTEAEEINMPWVRNFENGHTFRNIRNLTPRVQRRIEDAGVSAVEILGLDFGAADVLLGDDENTYVLEVNTGPGLADNSLEVYVQKFAELLEIPEDRLHWPDDMGEDDDAMPDVPEDELENMF